MAYEGVTMMRSNSTNMGMPAVMTAGESAGHGGEAVTTRSRTWQKWLKSRMRVSEMGARYGGELPGTSMNICVNSCLTWLLELTKLWKFWTAGESAELGEGLEDEEDDVWPPEEEEEEEDEDEDE